MSGVRRIDQMVAGFSEGDAISRVVLFLRDVFRAMNYSSDVYADPACVSPGFRENCLPLNAYAGGVEDICMHHYGISSPATALFKTVAARKVLVYHNITPAHFFEGFDDDVVGQLNAARESLVQEAQTADAVWAVSRFNADELEERGVENVRVFALPFTPGCLDEPLKPDFLHHFQRMPLKNILYVGRIAPNKRLENLIQAFGWYFRSINKYCRLLIIGSPRSCPRYYAMLKLLVGDLDLANVCFEGFAAEDYLVNYYHMADLFMTTSEHEGYCLPLIEAMYKNVPVLCRDAGGTPEALDGAGVLYEDLDAPQLAYLMHLVLSDKALRNEILQSQQQRMQTILNRDLKKELAELLNL